MHNFRHLRLTLIVRRPRVWPVDGENMRRKGAQIARMALAGPLRISPRARSERPPGGLVRCCECVIEPVTPGHFCECCGRKLSLQERKALDDATFAPAAVHAAHTADDRDDRLVGVQFNTPPPVDGCDRLPRFTSDTRWFTRVSKRISPARCPRSPLRPFKLLPLRPSRRRQHRDPERLRGLNQSWCRR